MALARLPRAYYSAPINEFLGESSDSILGKLTVNSEGAVEPEQRDAWLAQNEVLRQACTGIDGTLFLEFNIPRMGRRVDAVVLTRDMLFVVEFKVGEKDHKPQDIEQVWDYALDLKNFHEGSHHAAILPILVATKAQHADDKLPEIHRDLVRMPMRTNSDGLRKALHLGMAEPPAGHIDVNTWSKTPYHPTPTIIEAAQSLYAQHSVEDISRNDAGAQNLQLTSKRVEELIDLARQEGRKAICLVTGVPGAGKTLVGLNVATKRRESATPTHAVFLSGNGPLVAVLREALTRDEVHRRKQSGEKVRKNAVGESVKAFIQNVHHFRDEGLRDSGPPIDHVVIFDEAQRAWNLEQTANFMRNKKKQPGFDMSEPEFLLSYLNRHQDWAVVVCLVGGGQEINTGEAGIGAWLDAIRSAFPDWSVYISPELTDSEYAAGHAIEQVASLQNMHFDDSLHLAVSLRSFRAENLSGFVKAVLDCEVDRANAIFEELKDRYPIVLTRDLAQARRWIRRQAGGSQRYGLVASSQAQRLKPHAIDVRTTIDPIHWFLDGRNDTRSSYYLEDAATEFQVQGLELDWTCVTWDGDFRFLNNQWSFHSFRGKDWQRINKPERQAYLRNAYRVLLTRARQGMVIFVPEGSKEDPTRKPEYYDATYRYLRSVGIPELRIEVTGQLS